MSRPNDSPWIQAELDAGRDVDSTDRIFLCRNTLNFRAGSGCVVGSGLIRSMDRPILHAADGYERVGELLRHRIEGVEGEFDRSDWTDPGFLKALS